jgi:hypothetical protein
LVSQGLGLGAGYMRQRMIAKSLVRQLSWIHQTWESVSKPGETESGTEGGSFPPPVHLERECCQPSRLHWMHPDGHESMSCQHLEVASGVAPRFIDFRTWPRESVSVVHFSSGVRGESKLRSRVSIGSTGRVTEFESSKGTSSILSDSSWGVQSLHQKQLFEI